MRVGLDARWYCGSGVGTYILGLAQAILDFVPEIELFLYEHKGNQLPGLRGDVQRHLAKWHRYSPLGQLEMAHFCRRDKLDVFHAPFYLIPFLASCPVVVTIHDMMPFLFDLYNWPHQKLVQAGYFAGIKTADRVIADSHCTAGDIHRLIGIPLEQIDVIKFGPLGSISSQASEGEMEYLASHYGLSQPYVLTFSFTNWRTKNIDVALQGMLLARQMGSQFQAVVAGSQTGLQHCPASVLDQLQPVLTGFMPGPDLPLLYRHASVFVCTSAYEGLGLPLLEAMASGCAVVSSDGGSLPEVAGDGAAVVPVGDADATARQIHRLLSDEDECRRLRAAALRRAAEFTWQRTASETCAVYESALKQPRTA